MVTLGGWFLKTAVCVSARLYPAVAPLSGRGLSGVELVLFVATLVPGLNLGFVCRDRQDGLEVPMNV
jgi:hypothetical protein